MNKLSFLFFLIFISCSSAKNIHNTPLMSEAASFDKQGHRGCRGLMPENTIPAMIKALDLGVTTLEMDIAITKDKQPILSHDPWFARDITTKPDGTFMGEREERKFVLYWMSYEQVKTFDVGMKPHPRFPNQLKIKVAKPLLADVIDSCEKHAATSGRTPPNYNIETKTDPELDGVFHPLPKEFVDLLLAVIIEKQIQDRVIIQSFDFRTLQYVHQLYPNIRTAMLIEASDKRTLEEQISALGFVPSIYSPDYSLVNERLIAQCHKRQIKIIPWTVNDKETIRRLKAIGVDGIITDYPDLF